jgi:peptidoglycan L-alanyl-D-glutamate endopeptidase CwlK
MEPGQEAQTVSLSSISEVRLSFVMPLLAEKVRYMAEILELDSEPIYLVVLAGLRTWAEQNALYAQGRTLPGNIVTNAKGGESWHNFGCAVDCAPEIVKGQIDWNGNHPQWKRMQQVGESLGLTSGATWTRLVDAPHFQLTGPFPAAAPNDEARLIYANEGAQAFWQEVNRNVTT